MAMLRPIQGEEGGTGTRGSEGAVSPGLRFWKGLMLKRKWIELKIEFLVNTLTLLVGGALVARTVRPRGRRSPERWVLRSLLANNNMRRHQDINIQTSDQ